MRARRNMSLDDMFVPFPEAQRGDAIEAYAAHLAARDGIPEVSSRILPHREKTMARLAEDSCRFKGRIDPELFLAYVQSAHLRHPPATRSLPRDLLFVFACVRANTYEAYSVEKLIDTAHFVQETRQDRINLTVMLEESYHTRFLLSVAELFDLTVDAAPQPPLVVRALIAGLGYLPRGIAHPLTLCAEIMGLALFVKLFELAGTIFAAEPAMREAIEMRLGEVITDELGHISYNRLQHRPAGLKAARMLLPVVASGSRHGLPGTEGLGLCPFPFAAMQNFPLGRLPRFILDHAFIA